MKNLAPQIFRQRLLIEGFYSIGLDAAGVKNYLLGLAAQLSLRTYGEPVVFAPASGMGREENSGFDAFVPLIDSGISAYIWSKEQFFSVLVYTCKGFDQSAAVDFTRSYFGVTAEIAFMEI